MISKVVFVTSVNFFPFTGYEMVFSGICESLNWGVNFNFQISYGTKFYNIEHFGLVFLVHSVRSTKQKR